MASNLRKYKYTGGTAARPGASSGENTNGGPRAAPGSTTTEERAQQSDGRFVDTDALKLELLQSIKADISVVLKEELRNALKEDFDNIRADVQEVRNEIANNTAAARAEMDGVKATVKEVEDGLSMWSDEVVTLQSTVKTLRKELSDLKDKCDDMEGRMRRSNIRIMGVPEGPDSSSTTAVSALLREALGMDKDVIVDRSHRSLAPRRPGGNPRAIIAKLHYYQDCVEILRRARTQAPLRFNGQPIAIFPDFTTSVARARAAFTEVRKLLREQEGVRFGIRFPARLCITHNGEEKEFLDAAKAMEYVKEHIINV